MGRYLVLDIGNSRIKGAFFEDHALFDYFSYSYNDSFEESLFSFLKDKKIERILFASVNDAIEKRVKDLLKEKYPLLSLSECPLKLKLDVKEPHLVRADRIANLYGALSHFPLNDCIIVDIRSSITFDYAKKEGHYLGGAVYPGIEMSARALSIPFHLPFDSTVIEKPPSALGTTINALIQSGVYFGLLGAIERITAELSFTSPSPSSVKIIATGGATLKEDSSLRGDLKELVDIIDPHLTLVGLREILKECLNKEK